MNESTVEKRFWRYWLGGLLLLAFMIAMNAWFITDVSPWGIRDHQSAGTAAKIDAIQNAWQAKDVMDWARISIVIDLIYIAVYSTGAFCGGMLLAASPRPLLRRLGAVIMVVAVILAIADYTETICQFVQAMRFKGSDQLATIAATAQPIKSTAFLITFLGLLIALALRRMARPAA
jgi:hypothetical protein